MKRAQHLDLHPARALQTLACHDTLSAAGAVLWSGTSVGGTIWRACPCRGCRALLRFAGCAASSPAKNDALTAGLLIGASGLAGHGWAHGHLRLVGRCRSLACLDDLHQVLCRHAVQHGPRRMSSTQVTPASESRSPLRRPARIAGPVDLRHEDRRLEPGAAGLLRPHVEAFWQVVAAVLLADDLTEGGVDEENDAEPAAAAGPESSSAPRRSCRCAGLPWPPWATVAASAAIAGPSPVAGLLRRIGHLRRDLALELGQTAPLRHDGRRPFCIVVDLFVRLWPRELQLRRRALRHEDLRRHVGRRG